MPARPDDASHGAHDPTLHRRGATSSILALHADPDPHLLDRELSWLQFDERVLAIAEDRGTPLLERVRFLAIAASNLDEFFQVRVAGIMEQAAAGVTASALDGRSPSAQLTAIRTLASALASRMTALLHEDLLEELAAAGIRIVDHALLPTADRAVLAELFDRRMFPVITPLAVDPAHPFPYISSLSLNLAVLVRDRHDHGESGLRFARVKIPPILPRLVPLPDGDRFVPLEQVVAAHLDALFPGVEVVEHHAFRVTRNADLQVEEEEADDLLAAIETELTRRRFGRVVRLEVAGPMSETVLDLLVRELEVDRDAVERSDGPLDLGGLSQLADLDRPALRFAPFVAITPPELGGPSAGVSGGTADVFAVLRERDVLVHHPYDAFATSVQAFVEQAARDPRVLAIKQTLYRTSGPDSPIVRALLDAAAAGKQVVALVELKARFDEEANIGWARTLEEAGVHVTYGVVGLKTHTKVSLVVRDEGGIVRRYAHVGTGNYNDRTARGYEDLGLLTSDPAIGADLTDLFNVLTGYARRQHYRKLLVAPTTFRPRILELIAREAAAADGHVVLKLNSLVDPEVILALEAASRAGTRVDAIVRGICCLRPGVPGRSEHVRVRSIVGRHLEHSRLYRFGSAARGYDHLIGSGDLMPRNLDRRVEAVVPVTDPRLTARLEEIIDVCLADDVLAWELGPDSVWRRVPTVIGVDTHRTLEERAHRRAAGRVDQ